MNITYSLKCWKNHKFLVEPHVLNKDLIGHKIELCLVSVNELKHKNSPTCIDRKILFWMNLQKSSHIKFRAFDQQSFPVVCHLKPLKFDQACNHRYSADPASSVKCQCKRTLLRQQRTLWSLGSDTAQLAIKLSVAEMVVPIDLKVHEGATHTIQGSRFLVQDNSFIALLIDSPSGFQVIPFSWLSAEGKPSPLTRVLGLARKVRYISFNAVTSWSISFMSMVLKRSSGLLCMSNSCSTSRRHQDIGFTLRDIWTS